MNKEMSMKMKQIEYGAPAKQILAIPDHYVALGFKHNKATSRNAGLAVLEGGRYVVKAGTIYPANDATAIGLVLNDYDVTDGDQMMAVVIHGFIKVAALPAVPSANAIAAMKQITFNPLITMGVKLSGKKGTGNAAVTTVPDDVTFSLEGGLTFRDGAASADNWTFTGNTNVATKVDIDEIVLSQDKKSVTFKFKFEGANTATAAGSITALPDADVISINQTIAAAVTILTIA